MTASAEPTKFLEFLAESQGPRATFWSTTMSIQAAAMIASPLLNLASKGMDRLPDFPNFPWVGRSKRGKRSSGRSRRKILKRPLVAKLNKN